MKPTRRKTALQPPTGIDRSALAGRTVRRAPRQFERALQAAIVLFHATAVVDPLTALLFAVPNGEARDAATAGLLSGRRRRHPDLPPETDAEAMRPAGQGVLPGASDLVLLLGGGRTVLIEVKPPKTADYRGGTLSAPQRSFQRAAQALGHDIRVVTSVEQYQAVLVAFAVRLRVSACRFPRDAP